MNAQKKVDALFAKMGKIPSPTPDDVPATIRYMSEVLGLYEKFYNEAYADGFSAGYTEGQTDGYNKRSEELNKQN
jgi:hypothetical protein